MENKEIENKESDESSDEFKDMISIEDVNITLEMNTSQLAIQQQEQQEGDEQDIQTHRYDLRKRPTKCKEIVSMTQTG